MVNLREKNYHVPQAKCAPLKACDNATPGARTYTSKMVENEAYRSYGEEMVSSQLSGRLIRKDLVISLHTLDYMILFLPPH